MARLRRVWRGRRFYPFPLERFRSSTGKCTQENVCTSFWHNDFSYIWEQLGIGHYSQKNLVWTEYLIIWSPRVSILVSTSTTHGGAAQRAQNHRQKHVCFCLFWASWRPVFLFQETEFLCKKHIDPPWQALRGHPMRDPCIFVFARTGIVPHSTHRAC